MLKATDGTIGNIIEAQPRCLVDFTATWCGPCNTMKPALRTMEQTTGLMVVEADLASCPTAAQSFGVRSVPTLILFEQGQEVRRIVGAQRLQELMSFVGG